MNLVLTYNFADAADREEAIRGFRSVLLVLGLRQQHTNQSTFFGSHITAADFLIQLDHRLQEFDWREDDEVTLYHPFLKRIRRDNEPEIRCHQYKTAGSLDRQPLFVIN